MAARRNRHGRRRNRGRFGFLYKLLSALLIFAALLVGCVVFFRVNTVVVSGNSRYAEAEVIQSSGVEQGDNLFALNKYQISRQIYTQLPYVDEVSIHRKLPDTLLIQVTESYPVAALCAGGEYWLLDARCKLLERGDASLAQGKAGGAGPDAIGARGGHAPGGGSVPTGQAGQPQEPALRHPGPGHDGQRHRVHRPAFRQRDPLRLRSGSDGGHAHERRFYRPYLRPEAGAGDHGRAGVARTGTLDLTYGEGEARLLPERWLPASETAAETPEPSSTPETGLDTQGDTPT